MTRVSVQKVDDIVSFKAASNKGSGANGEILLATCLGRKYSYDLNGIATDFNRGSLVKFLNAQVQNTPSLVGRELEEGWFFGYGGCDDSEIKALFDDVINASFG